MLKLKKLWKSSKAFESYSDFSDINRSFLGLTQTIMREIPWDTCYILGSMHVNYGHGGKNILSFVVGEFVLLLPPPHPWKQCWGKHIAHSLATNSTINIEIRGRDAWNGKTVPTFSRTIVWELEKDEAPFSRKSS